MSKPDSISRFDWFVGMAMQGLLAAGNTANLSDIDVHSVSVAFRVMKEVERRSKNAEKALHAYAPT